MKTSLRVALAFAAVLALSGCQKTADAAFGQKVRAYLLEHPEVIEEAVQKLQEKKVADAANIAKAGLVKYRKALEQDSRDFVVNPNGKITVVEFFDYRCGYCKSSAPEIVKIIQDNPDVRFVFKEFPIFGGESNLAAKVALTSAGKAKGLALYQTFMAEKALDEAAIDRHLAAAGIDPAQAKAAGESAAVSKQISDTHELAQALGIEGTPAFIVGDRLVPGADMPALHAAIAAAKAGDVKAGD
ncbi:DsbA family protein [Phenylobacterium sp. 20VBR1]|uniref:DsbA family protein n=1 Tax=Phenylobacterium glaciei TaxID=2803784 RepID=A0A941HX01_9CAUL|nr:DsbA family protein [Phenylobacterium glaciei]MBR7619787.1 DsbA family protein [Phenylobacterium glaciei]QQZ48786.1 DsbA family protein [Phenylobacterium glaciei]